MDTRLLHYLADLCSAADHFNHNGLILIEMQRMELTADTHNEVFVVS